MLTQSILGVVTAALQMQKGGSLVPNNSDIPTSSVSDSPINNLLLGTPSTEQCPLITNQYDPLITTTSFNSSSAVRGIILGDTGGLG